MSVPSADGATTAHRVDWMALKSYIAEKEQFEAENGHPVPLSETELSAIAVLLHPAPRLDREVSTQNWLGSLNHFQQVRYQEVIFTDVPREYPRLMKAPDLRWACTATFTSTGDTFPRQGYGIDPGGAAQRGPDFQRKQDAKQYAAKAACKWLIDNGQMLPSGELPSYPKAFAPAASAAIAAASSSESVLPLKRSLPGSPSLESSGPSIAAAMNNRDVLSTRARSSSSRRRSNGTADENDEHNVPNVASLIQKPPKAPRTTSLFKAATSPSAPPPPLRSASASDSSAMTSAASSPSAGAPIVQSPFENGAKTSTTQEIHELCTHLKYPVPRYKLIKDTTVAGGDLWNGSACFGDDPRVPDDLGSVRKALTKEAAKERMEENILPWLIEELEKRDRMTRAVLE